MVFKSPILSPIKTSNPEIVQPKFKVPPLNYDDVNTKKTIHSSYSEPILNPTKSFICKNALDSLNGEQKIKRENRLSIRKRKSCSVDVSWQPNYSFDSDLIRNKNDKFLNCFQRQPITTVESNFQESTSPLIKNE